MRVLCFALLFPFVAFAGEQPVTATEFERLVTGKTYTYSNGGTPYGAEAYLRDRRVRWTFLDGECFEGEWYPAGDQICFVYEDIPNPQCWQFFMEGSQLTARFANETGLTGLYETQRQSEVLQCTGPKVGA